MYKQLYVAWQLSRYQWWHQTMTGLNALGKLVTRVKDGTTQSRYESIKEERILGHVWWRFEWQTVTTIAYQSESSHRVSLSSLVAWQKGKKGDSYFAWFMSRATVKFVGGLVWILV